MSGAIDVLLDAGERAPQSFAEAQQRVAKAQELVDLITRSSATRTARGIPEDAAVVAKVLQDAQELLLRAQTGLLVFEATHPTEEGK